MSKNILNELNEVQRAAVKATEGPVMVIYPQGHWYRDVHSEKAVDEILDALEDGRVAESHLLA